MRLANPEVGPIPCLEQSAPGSAVTQHIDNRCTNYLHRHSSRFGGQIKLQEKSMSYRVENG